MASTKNEPSITTGAEAPPSTPVSKPITPTIPAPIVQQQQQQQMAKLPPRPAVGIPPSSDLPPIAPEKQALLNQYAMGYAKRYNRHDHHNSFPRNRGPPVRGINHVKVQSPAPFRDPDYTYSAILRAHGISPMTPAVNIPPPPPPNTVLDKSSKKGKGGENSGSGGTGSKKKVNFRTGDHDSTTDKAKSRAIINDGKPRFVIKDNCVLDNINLDGAAGAGAEEPCQHCPHEHEQMEAQAEAQQAYVAALQAQEDRQVERKRSIGKIVLDTMAAHKMTVDGFTRRVEALEHAIETGDGKMARMQQDIAKLSLQPRQQRSSASSTNLTTTPAVEDSPKSTFGDKFQWFLGAIFCLPIGRQDEDNGFGQEGNPEDHAERRPLLEGSPET